MNSPTIELKDLPPFAVDGGTVPFRKPIARPLQKKRRFQSRPKAATPLGKAWRAGQFLLVPFLIFGVWWSVARFGLVSERILPAPLTVAHTFGDLISSGDLASNLGVSLWRVARGTVLGVSIGLALGLALGFSPAVESWIGPSFRVVAQVPSIAMIPLLMMVLGIDDKLKLFIMAKACVIPLALVTAEGIRTIPRTYLEIGDVFCLSRWTRIRRIILPGALPSIFTGVRQGVAHVWVSLVAVEVLASADGIGYLMTWGRQIFQLDVVLVCVGVIGVIGFILDFSLRQLETGLLRWQKDGDAR